MSAAPLGRSVKVVERNESAIVTPKIKILGWVHIVLSGLLLAAGLALCVALILLPDKDSRAAAMIVPMFMTLAVWLLLPGRGSLW